MLTLSSHMMLSRLLTVSEHVSSSVKGRSLYINSPSYEINLSFSTHDMAQRSPCSKIAFLLLLLFLVPQNSVSWLHTYSLDLIQMKIIIIGKVLMCYNLPSVPWHLNGDLQRLNTQEQILRDFAVSFSNSQRVYL